MKKRRLKGISVLSSLILLVSLLALQVFAVPEQGGDVIVLSAETVDGDGRAYYTFSTQAITLETGDILVYDVWANGEFNGVGALDFRTEDWSTLRDSPDATCTMGYPVAPHWVNANGEFAESIDNTWYRREILVPAGLVGKVTAEWIVAISGDFQSADVVVKYDNVKILKSDRTVKAVIYEEGTLPANFAHDDPGIFTVALNIEALPEIFDVNTPAATGDVIELSAETINGDGRAYYSFSNRELILEAGDSLVYDVWANGEYDGVGALDLRTEDWSTLRDSGTTCTNGFPVAPHWVNANGVFAESIDNTWYRRQIVIPESLIGKKTVEWIIAISGDFEEANVVVRYDNVTLLNSQGEIKSVIYENGLLPSNYAHDDPGMFTVIMRAIDLLSGEPLTEDSSQEDSSQEDSSQEDSSQEDSSMIETSGSDDEMSDEISSPEDSPGDKGIFSVLVIIVLSTVSLGLFAVQKRKSHI